MSATGEVVSVRVANVEMADRRDVLADRGPGSDCVPGRRADSSWSADDHWQARPIERFAPHVRSSLGTLHRLFGAQ